MARIFYGWWVLLASFVVSFFVGGTVFYSFTAFIDPLVDEFGWSYTQVSLASSLRGLEMGLFAPVAGILVDRYGTRPVTVLGMVFVGLGLLLLSLTNSLALFYIAFLTLSFGAGGCTLVVLFTAIVKWFQNRVGFALGVASSGVGASGFMVPLVVVLIQAYSWRTSLVILGLAAWLICVPLAFLLREPRDQSSAEPETGRAGSIRPPKLMGPEFKAALRSPSFVYVVLAESIRLLVVLAVITHIMPDLAHRGISRSLAGLAAAGVPIFSIAGRVGFGHLADRVDQRRALFLCFLMMAAGLICYVHLDNLILMAAFLILFSGGYGGANTLRATFLKTYFGTDSFGKLIGLMMGVSSLIAIIGPTSAGWLYDRTHSYLTAWWIGAGLVLVFAAGALFLPPPPCGTPVVGTDSG